MPLLLKTALSLFGLFFLLPLATSALIYHARGGDPNWWTADRSSTGLLPPPTPEQGAIVRIFSAQTVRWRGIFATHCWIVFKPAGAAAYTRYDYTAWGEPLRKNGFEPDGRWFGHTPDTVFAANDEAAAALIPGIERAIDGFTLKALGDYRPWPGPNSNTFISAIMDAEPRIKAALPPTAIGKDYPYDGRWLRTTHAGTGIRLNLAGYGGIALGWVEGVELNILGAVLGVDVRRPAIKLPGLGRLGFGGSGEL